MTTRLLEGEVPRPAALLEDEARNKTQTVTTEAITKRLFLTLGLDEEAICSFHFAKETTILLKHSAKRCLGNNIGTHELSMRILFHDPRRR